MAKKGPNTEKGKATSLQNLQKGMWKKGESGNPEGRPRRMIHHLCEKIGVDFNVCLTKDDKYQIIESMIEMSLTELKLIATDQNAPSFMVLIASAIKSDIANGNLYTLNSLFDRFFGKPLQTSEVVTREILASEEELLDEIEELNRKLKDL